MNTRLVISVLVLGALAFACGPRPSRSESAAPMATVATARPARHDARAAIPKLASDFGVRVGGEAVEFAMHVTNAGAKDVEISFPSGQTYDFVVLDSLGRQVWRWGDGRMFTQSLQNKSLSSGDDMDIAERWEHGALHGKYTAVATLRSSNFPMEQRVDFVVQ